MNPSSTTTVTEAPHSGGGKPAPAENPRAADARRASRPNETVQSIVNGFSGAPSDRTEAKHGARVETTVVVKGGASRSFTDHQREMLANLDKHGDVRGEGGGTKQVVLDGSKPQPAETKAETAPAKDPAPAADAKPETKVEVRPDAEKKPTEATPEPTKPDPELSAKVERLSEHNRKLLAKIEQLENKPTDLDDRMKALDAIENDLTTDAIGAMRRLVALSMGAKDDAPEVDRMLSHLYAEWTSHELKVPLDPGKRGEIGSDRNKVLIDRDRRSQGREAKARAAQAEKTAQAERTKTFVAQLGERLKTDKHGDKFPLLMEHSQLFDGLPPGDLLFSAISRGIAAGEFKADAPDKDLIEHYSKEIERYYQPRYQKLEEHFKGRLRDHFIKDLEEHFKSKFSAPSTATPAQASDSKTAEAADTKEAGVRTITNASASVAPPAPPQAATPPVKDDKPTPKFRNEDERRRYLASKWFPEA